VALTTLKLFFQVVLIFTNLPAVIVTFSTAGLTSPSIEARAKSAVAAAPFAMLDTELICPFKELTAFRKSLDMSAGK